MIFLGSVAIWKMGPRAFNGRRIVKIKTVGCLLSHISNRYRGKCHVWRHKNMSIIHLFFRDFLLLSPFLVRRFFDATHDTFRCPCQIFKPHYCFDLFYHRLEISTNPTLINITWFRHERQLLVLCLDKEGGVPWQDAAWGRGKTRARQQQDDDNNQHFL